MNDNEYRNRSYDCCGNLTFFVISINPSTLIIHKNAAVIINTKFNITSALYL